VRVVEEAELLADGRLRAVDPDLDSVLGVNDPAAYDAACARPQPEVLVHRTGVLASPGRRQHQHGPRGHPGRSGHGRGPVLDRHLLAAVNGDQVVRDVETPLVQGDSVTFLSADAGG
jgi:molybdopterin-guanine dinucleotide biosynthesis protein A